MSTSVSLDTDRISITESSSLMSPRKTISLLEDPIHKTEIAQRRRLNAVIGYLQYKHVTNQAFLPPTDVFKFKISNGKLIRGETCFVNCNNGWKKTIEEYKPFYSAHDISKCSILDIVSVYQILKARGSNDCYQRTAMVMQEMVNKLKDCVSNLHYTSLVVDGYKKMNMNILDKHTGEETTKLREIVSAL